MATIRRVITIFQNSNTRLLLKLLCSTGIGIDSPASDGMTLIKKRGKVKALEDEVAASKLSLKIAHT